MRLAGLFVVCMALVLCTPGFAKDRAVDICPSTKIGGEWSAQCFTQEAGKRTVKRQYRKRIDANAYGMAVITIAEPREMVAVNRFGIVVIPNIRHAGDFDYPSAEHGVGRFSVSVGGERGNATSKCGYFQAEQFEVVVPAQYDQCGPFIKGESEACTECVSYCTDADCHDSVFVGGKGVVLSPNGSILRTYKPPGIDQVCGGGSPAQISAINKSGSKVLTCKAPVQSPFKI